MKYGRLIIVLASSHLQKEGAYLLGIGESKPAFYSLSRQVTSKRTKKPEQSAVLENDHQTA